MVQREERDGRRRLAYMGESRKQVRAPTDEEAAAGSSPAAAEDRRAAAALARLRPRDLAMKKGGAGRLHSRPQDGASATGGGECRGVLTACSLYVQVQKTQKTEKKRGGAGREIGGGKVAAQGRREGLGLGLDQGRGQVDMGRGRGGARFSSQPCACCRKHRTEEEEGPGAGQIEIGRAHV